MLLRTLTVSLATPLAKARASFGQGRCMTRYGAPTCVTYPIAPVFAPTG